LKLGWTGKSCPLSERLHAAKGGSFRHWVNEALVDLVKKRNPGRPRAHVISAYEASHDEFAPLYKKLAE
jgi:hypothetical protein